MDIFTKYLRTVKGVLNVTTPSKGEVVTDLGFEAQAVPVSSVKQGTLVVFDTTQEAGVLNFKPAAAGDVPVGYVATKVVFDFNRNKYVTDIKLFGFVFEAAVKTSIANGASVGFIIPAAADATDKEYEVPMVAAAATGSMILIQSSVGSKAGEFIADIYVPMLDTGVIA